MTDLLLTTKFQMPPARPNLVARPRLLAQLDEGLDYPLMLISAPPGFGKTTVVSGWLRQRGANGGQTRQAKESQDELPVIQVAWLALAEDDNDSTRFFTYLSSALDPWHPGLAETVLTLLDAASPPAPRTIITMLINTLSQLPVNPLVRYRPYVLVLDDYHLIHAAPIHDALTFFVEHAPPQLHLLLTSRIDPSLPLATWRARGQLAELRAADLRFTSAEAVQFLNDTMALALTPADVEALETRTEGWAAGLQLAALALRGRTERTTFLQEFTGGHRYILGYLVDEVLARQPAEVQQFLLHTAVLERLSGALCDAVTDRPGSQATLDLLYTANLFTIALDEQGAWYRYHHLFRDVLRLRLQQTQPDLLPTLHQRASQWYEEQGLLDEAIEHAVAAADLQRAGDLIAQHFLHLWKHGALGTLRRWMDRLPETAFTHHLDLAFWSGVLLGYTGQLDRAETRLAFVEAELQAAADGDARSDALHQRQGRLAVMQGMLAIRRGHITKALALADQAFALLPAEDLVFRGGVYPLLGLAYVLQGDLLAAQQAYEQAAVLARQADHWFLLSGALGRLVPVQLALGRLHAAANTCQQVLALPIVQSGRVPAAGYAHAGLAEVYYQWNELETARDHATTGIALGETSQITDLNYIAVLAAAKVHAARGDATAAFAMIQRGYELAPQVGGSHMTRRVQALEALFQLRIGQVEAAARWARSRNSADTVDPIVTELEGSVEARLWLTEGQPATALTLLQALLPVAAAAQRTGSVLELLMLQARAYAALHQPEQVLATLERALILAAPERYVRLFVDEGATLVDLLRAVGRQPAAAPLRPYVERLLAAFVVETAADADRPSQPVATGNAPATVLIEPLSEREQAVLQLVAEGASNEQIATILVISIHTVRKHMSNILGKLDVASRTEAVARARQLSLL